MSSGERQRLQEEQLKGEIEELRGELGETVEALVHKADLPARAKERGAELTERAVDRGVEFSAQATEWFEKFKAQTGERGSELRAQALGATERAREAVYQTPPERWAKVACAGLALITIAIIARRIRIS